MNAVIGALGQDRSKKDWWTRSSLRVIPLDGGQPRALDIGRQGIALTGAARIRPDGSAVAFGAVEPFFGEVWKLENFLPPAGGL